MDNNNSAENSRDGLFRIYLSKDAMEATLELEPPTGEGKWPTKDDAVEVLRSAGIVHGVIDGAIEQLARQGSPGNAVVARGTPPQAGTDAELNLFFETESVWKFANEDQEQEKIDYRNIQTIQTVQIGQVIAEKVPATKGEAGCDVCGRPVNPTAGKDKFVRLGKNVVWAEDNLRIVSKINGEPSFINNQINVFPIHEVNGDVNFTSGNIQFPGSLIIKGNVDGGFKVEADGDITINGSVEAAEIRAGGNITIRGGITGRDKCTITCNGDFTAKYIEYAKVDCDGNVVVKEAILHCEVNANGRVAVETGKGLIVGGVVRAGEDIAAKTIGSKFGTTTELEAGVKPRLKIEYQQLESVLAANKENLDKAEKATAILEKLPHLPPERKEMYQNLLKTVKVIKTQNIEVEERRKAILEEMVLSKGRGRIRVKDILYPGVKVTIAGAVLIIQDECKFVNLVYGEGEVKVQAYR